MKIPRPNRRPGSTPGAGTKFSFNQNLLGKRSKRFAVVIKDGVVEKAFVEPDATADNPDPYGESSPENVMNYLGIAK